jgi:hypothetical protein
MNCKFIIDDFELGKEMRDIFVETISLTSKVISLVHELKEGDKYCYIYDDYIAFDSDDKHFKTSLLETTNQKDFCQCYLSRLVNHNRFTKCYELLNARLNNGRNENKREFK